MQRLAGFPDLDQARLTAIAALRAAIFDVLGAFGYTIVEPPVIELPDAFIERSGESIRDKMYFLQDPQGRELCLRPELTIPTCRMLLRSSWDRQSAVRVGYHGPVFRYETPGAGRYRQFGQIGAECIGRGQSLVADAEIVALAARAVRAGGVANPWLLFGDIRFLNAVLEAFAVPEKLRQVLKAALPRMRSAAALKTLLDGCRTALQTGDDPKQREFMGVLSELGPDRSAKLIERILAMSDISLVGTRKIRDMVRRMTDRQAADRTFLPDEVIAEIFRFSAIADAPARAMQKIEAFCADHKIDAAAFIDAFHQRLDLIGALGVETDNSCFEASLRRPVDYYTGFIFEIYQSADTREIQLAGGGRYDRLMNFLDPAADIPAVGFAIGLERLLALREEGPASRALAWQTPVDAVIAAAQNADQRFTMRAAAQLRHGGWTVRVELQGTVPEKTPLALSGHQARYAVLIGGKDAEEEHVTVRDLAKATQQIVPLNALADFARAEIARRPIS